MQSKARLWIYSARLHLHRFGLYAIRCSVYDFDTIEHRNIKDEIVDGWGLGLLVGFLVFGSATIA